MERLHLPLYPTEENVRFMTPNGLPLADGYNGVVMTEKGPMVEFLEKHLNLANICVPQPMLWRRKHPEAYYVEYRSRDYCSVKVFEQRREAGNLKPGYYYILAFDIISDKYPILIERLHKRRVNDE
jgi:hypothetical protein